MDLSILICSLPNRLNLLYRLITEINNQSIGRDVQILYLGDNKSMTVGQKRNHLLSNASGKYVTFIDDDDRISPEYISSIFEGIDRNPEVITFQVAKLFNGLPDRTQKFNKDYGKNHRSPDKKFNLMLPNHLCVWRRDVIKEKFPNSSLGEDWKWAELMVPHYTDEYHIEKILYTYDFNKETTETQ